jgi:lysophospholipase-2
MNCLLLGRLSLLLLMLSRVAAMSTSKSSIPRGALVFLHGLGDTPYGWTSLTDVLPSLKPSLANIKYVLPPAPTIPITINGGAEMPGWFDVLDWPIGIKARDDEKGINAAVKQIEAVVAELEKEGIPKSRIVLGGFSQGGAIAIQTAYRQSSFNEAYAGCVALSGWLTLEANLQIPAKAKETPIFWGHGEYDDKVLFEQQAFGVAKLKEKGVESVEHASYPMGHESDPGEMQAMATFLDKIFFGEDDCQA